jgi:predicted nucleic acid-binding Zn ribbon protein
MAKSETKRFCLNCEEPIKGRADKKFCDDQCRTAFNNQLKADTTFMRNINNALRKNRKIMEDLLSDATDGKRKVQHKTLLDKGYNFAYHTHTYITLKGGNYIFCYEYGFLKLENEIYMVVKRNEP